MKVTNFIPVTGGEFNAENAEEIKTVINTNADTLDALIQDVNDLEPDLSSILSDVIAAKESVEADASQVLQDKQDITEIRDEIEVIKQNATGSYESKGDWNPTTNIPILTANSATGSSWVPNVSGKPQRYTITVSGALPFAIKGYSQGAVIPVGYLVEHSSGEWYYEPQDTEALTKISQITTSTNGSTNLITSLIDLVWASGATNTTDLTASSVSKHTNLIPIATGDVIIFEGIIDTLNNATFGKIFNASNAAVVTVAISNLVAIPGGYKYQATAGGTNFNIGFNIRNGDSVKAYKGYQVEKKIVVADSATQYHYAKDSEIVKKSTIIDETAYTTTNIAAVIAGSFYTGSSPTNGTTASGGFSRTPQLSTFPGEKFLINGLTATLNANTFIKVWDVANKMVGPAIPVSALTDHPQGGKIFTVPIDRVGIVTFGMNITNPDVVTIYRMKDKIKSSVLPTLSELTNDAGFITSADAPTNSSLFDITFAPENEAVWQTGYWGGSTTQMGTITTSTTYDHCIPITVDAGFQYAISGLNATLALATFGKYFNSSGVQVGSNISIANLTNITGGKLLTVPNLTDVRYLGLNINHADGNVLVQAGNEVILEDLKVIKPSLLPEFSGGGETVEAADAYSRAYIRGLAPDKIPTKKYGILAMGQSNIETDGRIPASSQPSWFVDAGRIIDGALFCNNENGTFANYSRGSNSLYSFELYLYKLMIDYLKISNPSNQMYIVKHAAGGTPISELAQTDPAGYWQIDFEKIPSGKRLLSYEARLKIKKALELQGANFEFRAIVWHQGETDRLGAADDYYDNLAGVIGYIRAVIGNPNLPFIIGGISTSSSAYNSTINAAMRKLAEDISFVYYAEAPSGTENLVDTLHFNALGGEILATNVFNIIKDF